MQLITIQDSVTAPRANLNPTFSRIDKIFANKAPRGENLTSDVDVS